MTTTVIAYFPSPPQGVWHLGPIPLRAYALFIIIGIIAALLIGDRRWAARGGERGVIYDIALWAVPFGLIGGRLYHLATDWRTYFGEGGAGPIAALRIWDGGLGIWGAVALGGVGAWIACRRRGIPLPAFGEPQQRDPRDRHNSAREAKGGRKIRRADRRDSLIRNVDRRAAQEVIGRALEDQKSAQRNDESGHAQRRNQEALR